MDFPLLFAVVDLDLVKVAGIILAGVIVVSDMYFDHRKRELWHQTVRIALEKGQPIPESFALLGGERNRPRWRGYLLGGLINLATGRTGSGRSTFANATNVTRDGVLPIIFNRRSDR